MLGMYGQPRIEDERVSLCRSVSLETIDSIVSRLTERQRLTRSSSFLGRKLAYGRGGGQKLAKSYVVYGCPFWHKSAPRASHTPVPYYYNIAGEKKFDSTQTHFFNVTQSIINFLCVRHYLIQGFPIMFW